MNADLEALKRRKIDLESGEELVGPALEEALAKVNAEIDAIENPAPAVAAPEADPVIPPAE